MTARGRRGYGAVRKLPSGNFQARYTSTDGRLLRAPGTFASRREAERWLAQVQTDQSRGLLPDGEASQESFADYAARWVIERPTPLRPRTVELYSSLLRRHIVPTFGTTPLAAITPAAIRSWHGRLLRDGVGESTRVKAYRLFRAVLATAVDDELLVRNPVKLRGIGSGAAAERTPPPLSDVALVVEAVEPQLRLLVLLAAWSGLRFGELLALRRGSVDVDEDRGHASVRVDEQLVELNGKIFRGPPKTAAGRRLVALPPHLLPALVEHLEHYVDDDEQAPLFRGLRGGTLSRSAWTSVWRRAMQTSGVPPFRFHDLRHLAATMAAQTGATTRELMHRMGHSSPRAALIYQHATAERDAEIAQALSVLAGRYSTPPAQRAVSGDGVVIALRPRTARPRG